MHPSVAAELAEGQRRTVVGPLPEWDLSDLYPGLDSAALDRDLTTLVEDVVIVVVTSIRFHL